jgi:peptide-methionine (S)-S-oxide reductase
MAEEFRMTQKAVFAAGCFWHVEDAFSKVPGVVSTVVGYTGGEYPNPTYENVCSGKTGHAEAVEMEFDSSKVSYDQLLDLFWKIHDPTTMNRQGPDIGEQYRSAIFYLTPDQEAAALASKERLEKSGAFKNRKIVTQILPAKVFFRAEEYHQKYFQKSGRFGCRSCGL